MFEKRCAAAAVVLLALAPTAHAAEPEVAPETAPQLGALLTTVGCWEGRGEVMGKPVTITLVARPIVLDALLAMDAQSTAIADPGDRYAAHLIFGGGDKRPGSAVEPIVGFWGDSFGGSLTATGQGEGRADGFDMSYQYGADAFVNRWRVSGDRLTWRIVARDAEGAQKPFASYALGKVACGAAQDR